MNSLNEFIGGKHGADQIKAINEINESENIVVRFLSQQFSSIAAMNFVQWAKFDLIIAVHRASNIDAFLSAAHVNVSNGQYTYKHVNNVPSPTEFTADLTSIPNWISATYHTYKNLLSIVPMSITKHITYDELGINGPSLIFQFLEEAHIPVKKAMEVSLLPTNINYSRCCTNLNEVKAEFVKRGLI
jgi:hypothetical protein